MGIVLDEHVPQGVRNQLPGHEVASVQELGWSGIVNGKLLALADEAAFDVFITGDLNIRYQNDLAARRIAIIAISTTHWPRVRASLPALRDAVESASQGTYRSVHLPQSPHRRRPSPP
jgi:hypothetical protein